MEFIKSNWVRLAFFMLAVVYLVQTIFTSVNKALLLHYNVTSGQLKALALTVVIPYIIIWFIALIGYERLLTYAESIRESKDGQAFLVIAKGLLLLALWLPVTAVVSNFLSRWYQHHPALTNELTIFNNYFDLAILVPAFYLLRQGSRRLLGVIKQPEYISIKTVMWVILFSAFYVLLVSHDPSRNHPTATAPVAAYYEPDWLIIATIIVPRLIMWFFGIQAMYNIYRYMYKVKAPIYSKSLQNLANGICGVVIAVIVLRCVQSLGSTLGHLGLLALLLIVYGLLLLLSIGFVLIAMGTRSLRQIEKI